MEEATRQLEALRLYDKATLSEREGNLGEALKLYRRAYKTSDVVEELYRQRQREARQKQEQEEESRKEQLWLENGGNNDTNKKDENYDPSKPTFIELLPNEVLAIVLRAISQQDFGAFTRMTYSNRRICDIAYTDKILWQRLCIRDFALMKYDPPPSLEFETQDDIVDNLYESSWRKMYLERPRLSFNGIYICKCDYYRAALASVSLTSPIFLVTYYRYLRFFPDGSCLSLVSTDSPQQVVYNFDMKSIHPQSSIGSSGADSTTNTTVGEPSPRRFLRGWWAMDLDGLVTVTLTHNVPGDQIYIARLQIKSSPAWKSTKTGNITLDKTIPIRRSRHHQLVWKSYYSIDRQSHEGNNDNTTAAEREFPIHNAKPYYFSRVLSYPQVYTPEF